MIRFRGAWKAGRFRSRFEKGALEGLGANGEWLPVRSLNVIGDSAFPRALEYARSFLFFDDNRVVLALFLDWEGSE